MGLFKKEDCCLCGGKTGLLDKNCLSGKVCKECRGKLSPWFDDFKGVDKGLLEGQIGIRELNLMTIECCHFNKIFGDHGVILIDEDSRKFVAFPKTNTKFFGSQRKVESIDDVIDLGPDIIEFDMVKDLKVEITETYNEEKRTVNGKPESYSPPRYIYFENFAVKIKLDHPYIRNMNIRLNNSAVQINNVGRRLTEDAERLTGPIAGAVLGAILGRKIDTAEYFCGFRCTPDNLYQIEKYEHYLSMAREIENIITGR